VVCADINGENAEKTAADLTAKGHTAIGMAASVANEVEVEAMVQTAVDSFGGVDILVNNAGIAAVGPAEETTLDDWQRVVDVNLTGVFLCAKAAGKAMMKTGRGGRIINIASILGAVGSQPVSAASYAATKGAVVNLTRDLAIHWAPHNIRVNALGPAYFPSEMTAGLMADPAMLAAVEQRTPMGRVGRPEELKGPIVFLASDASSYVTGQTLYVDGGWTAW
jgi:gluconate 5-dehydrogenase